jgi:hypothetical protein
MALVRSLPAMGDHDRLPSIMHLARRDDETHQEPP